MTLEEKCREWLKKDSNSINIQDDLSRLVYFVRKQMAEAWEEGYIQREKNIWGNNSPLPKNNPYKEVQNDTRRKM